MKLRSFVFSAMAAVMAFVACEPESALDTSKLELSQTSMTFEKTAGSQTLTITSGRTWQAKITEAAEWVSVTPKTGSGAAGPQTITVSVLDNPGYERTTTIMFDTGLLKENLKITQKGSNESVETATLDPEKTYSFRKTNKVVSGQWYVMVATKNNKLLACNDPSSDATNYPSFAYPKGIEVADANGVVSVKGGAAYLFSASEDGFTIKNNAVNKYIVQAGTYGSFSLADTPAAGSYWDITKNDDDTFKILNKTASKWVVMQNKYDSFAITDTDITDPERGGTMPWLYEYVGEAAAPEYTTVTVEQFYTSTDSYLSVKGQVVAVGDETMVINDGGDKSLYVYVGEAPGVVVNDVVKVDGLKTTYGMSGGAYTQLSQLKDVTITKIEETITAKAATPAVLTSAQIDAPYSNAETSLIQVDATASVDGSYINLDFGGKTTGSVVKSAVGTQLSSATTRLTITGYYAGINTRGYLCILPVSFEESTSKYFNILDTELEVSASATSAKIEIKGNVAWTAECETEGFTLSAASGTGNSTVTVNFAANESEQAKEATVKISTTDEGVTTKEYTVTITQAKYAEEFVLELSAATKLCDDFPSTTQGVTTTTTYTIGDYEWTFSPSTGNKFSWYSQGYVLWGKQGGYILMPAIEGKKLTSVTILTGSGASTSVNVGVYDAEGTAAVSGGEAIVLNTRDAEFSWTLTGTKVNTRYQLRVTSSHNAQFQKLTLKYE